MTIQGAFSGLSVDDLAKAKEFYTNVLGLTIDEREGMGFEIQWPGGGRTFVYEKKDHKPATYTALNFAVGDIDAAVDELVAKGIVLERYPDLHQDEKGIGRGRAVGMGPDIAWFKDPAGNILSVVQ